VRKTERSFSLVQFDFPFVLLVVELSNLKAVLGDLKFQKESGLGMEKWLLPQHFKSRMEKSCEGLFMCDLPDRCYVQFPSLFRFVPKSWSTANRRMFLIVI
jgi:hypothetical protein